MLLAVHDIQSNEDEILYSASHTPLLATATVPVGCYSIPGVPRFFARSKRYYTGVLTVDTF